MPDYIVQMTFDVEDYDTVGRIQTTWSSVGPEAAATRVFEYLKEDKGFAASNLIQLIITREDQLVAPNLLDYRHDRERGHLSDV